MTPTVSVLVAGVLWSFSGVLIKAIHWDGLRIAGMRSLIGGTIQFAFLLWCLRRDPRHAGLSMEQSIADAWRRLFSGKVAHWLGAILFVVNMIALAFAFRLTSATNAVFLHYSGMILVALLSYPVLKQPLQKHDWIALVLACLGIFLFCLDGFQLNASLGTALGVLCGITLAGTQLCLGLRAQDTSERKGALETVILANLIMAAIALPFILSDWKNMPPANDWWLLIALGIFPWGLPDVLYVTAIEHVPIFRALILGLSDPVLTAVWRTIFLNDYPTPLAIAGSLIIVWAIVYQAYAGRGESSQ